MVQQLSRALRLCNGKTEMASAFIWTRPDNLELADMLERLCTEDHELGRRVRVVSGEQVRAVQLANTDAFVGRFHLAGVSFIDAACDRFIRALAEFNEREGHTFVPTKFTTSTGYNLGDAVSNVRRGRLIQPDDAPRCARLAELNFVWDAHSITRDEFLHELALFSSLEGHVRVPWNFVTSAGYKLGMTVSRVRSGQLIRPDDAPRLARLAELNFVWDELSHKLDEFLLELSEFSARERHACVPNRFVTSEGYKLGEMVRSVRSGKLIRHDDAPRRARLAELNFVWDVHAIKRDEFLHELNEFRSREGHTCVPARFSTSTGYNLGEAVRSVRKGKLIPVDDGPRRARLQELQFVWDARKRPRVN